MKTDEATEAGDELVDAVLGASRALVAVAARSLVNVAEDVTLAQYRVLVELAARGPQRLADLADAVGVDPSTMTRMADRLVRKGLVSRRRASTDRRTVKVSLASPGRQLVLEVTPPAPGRAGGHPLPSARRGPPTGAWPPCGPSPTPPVSYVSRSGPSGGAWTCVGPLPRTAMTMALVDRPSWSRAPTRPHTGLKWPVEGRPALDEPPARHPGQL